MGQWCSRALGGETVSHDRQLQTYGKLTHGELTKDPEKGAAIDGYAKESPHKEPHLILQLEKSTYDCSLLALCFVEDTSIANDRWVYFQLFFTWFLHFAVIGIQVSLLVLLYATVVEWAENPFEHGLKEEIAALNAAVSTNTALNKTSPVTEMCRKDHTFGLVHIIVVTIWLSRMLQELRHAVEMVVVVLSLPTGHESIDEEIILDSKGDIVSETYVIVRLTLTLKILIVFFICGIRLVVTAFLTFSGAKFLILTGDMGNVILKAVSMQFIVTLDKVINQSFVPTAFNAKLKAAKIRYPGTKPSLFSQWSASCVYMLATVMAAYLLHDVIFGKISEFRTTCREYYMAFPNERKMVEDVFKSIQQSFGESLRVPGP